MEPLAHSGRRANGIRPQKYADHIRNVTRLASAKMEAALRHSISAKSTLGVTISWASEFHDLGKLEVENQLVLQTNERGPLPINHVDAGVAHLSEVREREAAIAVYGHHIGLCDIQKEKVKEELSTQDPSQAACRDYDLKLATDARLPKLIQLHREAVGSGLGQLPSNSRQKLSGLDRRLLLSCLVDADHFDTASHYGEQSDVEPAECRWHERLAALDLYVSKLGAEASPRSKLRTRTYEACRSTSPAEPIWACDSPVGSGKTTAVMAYMIQAAIQQKLRRIFVVLPYTNIIQQSVATYRRALTLPGEDPEMIVAAHHHQAEFKSLSLRYLTLLWEAPIIITTAVQFFETLGTNQTSRLRKLHQLPGSAIFVDEAHAAMPIHLWPFMWQQITALTSQWGCRFVLGSGSLAKFWENPRVMGEGRSETLPLMIPNEIRQAGMSGERSRVEYKSCKDVLTLSSLCDWIETSKGTRLVVMNTVQSAAVVASELRNRGVLTLHLSTALAPIHRKVIERLVRWRLKMRPSLDWVLVATSCVEAGVDFSFNSAFRERCRVSSLIQIGGRVNRHGEGGKGDVWDFVAVDPELSLHPNFNHSRDVVEEVFTKAMWEKDTTELMSYALEQEFKRQSGEAKIAELEEKEKLCSYPLVADLTRLIDADTRLVVIDRDLVNLMRSGKPIPKRDLLARSVQLWSSKIEKFALSSIDFDREIFSWDYDYDSRFTGVMAGILKLGQIDRQGFALI